MRALKGTLVALAVAAGLALPGSATATGSWNCTGAWHVWTYCPSTYTGTTGTSSIQVFSLNGAPYQALMYVYDNFNRLYTYGPFTINTTGRVTFRTVVGRGLFQFRNNNETNAGPQLYNVQVG